MTFPPGFRKSLVESIRLSYKDEYSFQTLIQNLPDLVAFEDVRPMGVIYLDALGMYVDELLRRGMLDLFMKSFFEDRSNNEDVKTIYDQYNSIFIFEDQKIKIRQKQFHREVVKNRTILFVTREPFCDGLARLVNRDALGVLSLTGESQTGLSFVHWYLEDLEEELKCFKFLLLNIKDLQEWYPDETIGPAHLAERITSRLKIPFPGIKDFKTVPFLASLEQRVDDMIRNDEKWLLFVDQYDHIESPGIKAFIKHLGRIAFQYPNTLYFVFSAYDKWEEEWGSDLADKADTIRFEYFSEEQIYDYLNKLYDTVEKDFKPAINRATFLETAKNSLPPALFDTSKGSNVPVVGKELKIWYRQLKKKLKTDG
jgi:hypothetical protein